MGEYKVTAGPGGRIRIRRTHSVGWWLWVGWWLVPLHWILYVSGGVLLGMRRPRY